MAKDAAETEEYFAGIRTFFFGIRTRKNGAYGSKALKHKKRGLKADLSYTLPQIYSFETEKKKTEAGGPYLLNSQKATAAAAATLSESTPWCMGMRTV